MFYEEFWNSVLVYSKIKSSPKHLRILYFSVLQSQLTYTDNLKALNLWKKS